MAFDGKRSRRWSVVALGAAFGAAALVTVAAGCKKPQKASGEVVSATAEGPAVDPELARVMATASGSAAKGAPGQAADGPPETGVFGPGEADRQITRGSPAKLTVGGTGSEPRVRLTGRPPLGKSTLRVRSMAQRGNNQDVPVDVDLALEVAAPKAPVAAPAGSGVAAAPTPVAAPGAGPALLAVTARVTAAKVDATLVTSVPKDIDAVVGKLKNSRITFLITESGAGTGFVVELAKGAEAGLEAMLNSLSDVLAVLTMPYPAEPVGVGAIWMATTREDVLGIDTVAYRLMKVQAVQGERVTLEVNSRRFATDARQNVPGITADGPVELQQFKAEGSGTVEVVAAAGIPDTGVIQYALVALVLASEQPQPMLLQERGRYVIGSPALAAPTEPAGPLAQ